MNTGCCALISRSNWWNAVTRLLCLDSGDDYVSLASKNPGDDNNDDGEDRVDLVGATQADDIMSILSENPELIQIADPVGDTVLHMLARNGDIQTVCKLIAFMDTHGYTELKTKLMKEKNGDGDTALHVALKNGHKELAYHLVKAEDEAAVILNNDGITPLTLAREAGFNEVLSLMPFHLPATTRIALSDVIMETVTRDVMDTSNSIAVHWNELHTAITTGIEVKDLVERGLLRHSKELLLYQCQETGDTLLHGAVRAAELGVGTLEQLLQFIIRNRQTNAAAPGNKKGDTALYAVQTNELTTACYLIKAAPETVYQVNHKGVSPLYLAVKTDQQYLVKHMFQMLNRLPGFATKILSYPKHSTLAHLAIKTRSSGTLKTLMKHLPELIKATDKKGWRPLSYAANKGYLNGVTHLLTNFPKSAEIFDEDGTFPIHKAVGGGHVSIVKAFIKHCPQTLHHIDTKGRSALHIAVIYGRDDIFTYLMKKVKLNDSFLNLRDNEGKTFMDHAEELKY